MKLLSWNVRGLGKSVKRRRVKLLLKDRKIDFVFFQETKKSEVTPDFVKSLWPVDEMEFMAVDSEGRAGGLLCIWKPTVFKLSQCCSTRHCIVLSGTLLPFFNCVLVNVHAPNEVNERSRFWNVLYGLRPSFYNPWCLVGDFNEIRNLGERRGCSRRDRGMKEFNLFIENMELLDLPMLGRQFTWCNSNEGERWSRIDRALMSTEWVEKLNLKLWGLERSVSDHCPLLLVEDGRDWGPRPFWFINAWTSHPKFGEVVKKSWVDSAFTGWAGFIIMNKLKVLRSVLKKWNVEVFGNVTHSLKTAEEELHAIGLVAESRRLMQNEVKRRREVRKEVWSLNRREEWLWRQKSRVNWSLKGDKNTRFFHVIATSRQNRNLLNSIEVDGEIHEDPQKIKVEVAKHFKNRFC
ncbi:uncharacterized protein LOC114309252 [Camellia sinensis]|uniref:uncharacterized protein LOC114309252 n=1 Tax=Camellia sinensis TaxID=4442 RepID=UPI0010365483|nr:uncharacterized protein LOC114309252 [Camellia sinensis]